VFLEWVCIDRFSGRRGRGRRRGKRFIVGIVIIVIIVINAVGIVGVVVCGIGHIHGLAAVREWRSRTAKQRSDHDDSRTTNSTSELQYTPPSINSILPQVVKKGQVRQRLGDDRAHSLKPISAVQISATKTRGWTTSRGCRRR